MANFYQNPTAAWKWVLILFKLSTREPGQPLKLAPINSLHTARAKLYGGRQYLEATINPVLSKYVQASLHTKITTADSHLLITADEGFHPEFSSIPADEFGRAVKFIHNVPKEGGTFYPEVPFSAPQTSVLRDYVGLTWKSVVTPTMVALAKLI